MKHYVSFTSCIKSTGAIPTAPVELSSKNYVKSMFALNMCTTMFTKMQSLNSYIVYYKKINFTTVVQFIYAIAA